MNDNCIQDSLFASHTPMTFYVLPFVLTHKTFINNKYKEITIKLKILILFLILKV